MMSGLNIIYEKQFKRHKKVEFHTADCTYDGAPPPPANARTFPIFIHFFFKHQEQQIVRRLFTYYLLLTSLYDPPLPRLLTLLNFQVNILVGLFWIMLKISTWMVIFFVPPKNLCSYRVMNVRRSYLRIRFNTSWTNHVRACGEV